VIWVGRGHDFANQVELRRLRIDIAGVLGCSLRAHCQGAEQHGADDGES